MWYVIWTSTGKEKHIQEITEVVCKDLYSRCFVPIRRINIKRKQRWFTVDKALFPGYLFVNTDNIGEVARKLKNIEGFVRILESDKKYLPLSEEEASFINKLDIDGGTFNPSVGIIEGDKVRVISGPLCGHEAFIRKIDRHKRSANIEFNMFGRTIRTAVGLEIIEKQT